MDPFTIALATFGIQKLRGKSTNRALRDAALAGGIGQVAGMSGMVPGVQAFGQTSLPGMTGNFIGQAAGPNISGAAGVNQTLSQQMGTSVGGLRDLVSRGIGTKDVYNPKTGELIKEGSGFMGLGTGEKLGLTLAGTTLLAGEDEPTEMPEGTRPEDYAAAKEKADKQLENILNTYDYESEAAGISPYNYGAGSGFTFNKGGIAEVRKFNSGGINYLPSKTDHDEKDVNNYVRAMGYVEDGAGNGDKDEDTMLAQLADGEFVSRADAILGAGIMEGANPKSFKDMRKKGAAFFYGQQAKFKRIFDLLDEARKEAN
jgi:hypothetical protein